MDWETILTSGVIAAIVAGIIELFKLNNSNKATFVIKQREEWREKIRGIATDIDQANKNSISKPLVELKTRINAYGKIEHPTFQNEPQKLYEYYMKDGHIYTVIDKLEQKEDFETNKKKLIYYLSALLKFDWERSKREAIFNKTYIISVFLEVLGLTTLFFSKDKNSMDFLMLSIILCLFYSFPILSFLLLKGVECTRLEDTEIKIFLVSNIFNSILLIFGILKDDTVLVLASVFMLLASMFLIIRILSSINLEKTYVNSLEEFDFGNIKLRKGISIQDLKDFLMKILAKFILLGKIIFFLCEVVLYMGYKIDEKSNKLKNKIKKCKKEKRSKNNNEIQDTN